MKRIFLFICMLAAVPSMLRAADNLLTMSIAKSDIMQWELTIQLNNPNNEYSGFQIDFQLPNGITLNAESVAATARTANITMQASVATNGLPRIVGYADKRTNSITGTNGTLFTVKLDMTDVLPEDDYEIVAKNVRFTTADGAEDVLPNATCVMTVDNIPVYKLIFWNGHEEHYSVMLPEGAPISLPDEPTPQEGYTFCGWGEVPETMPAANVELWAVWCVIYYEVKFVVDGEVIHSEQVAYGSPVPQIDAPEVEGYFFVGWEGEQFSEMPAKDLTYTAKYAKIGDVNQDGTLNTADIVAIYNYIVNGEESGIDKIYADVNGDGEVNTVDVTNVYDIITNGN